MPPAIPLRVNPGQYHFHAYDYAGSAAPGQGPFALSAAQPARGGLQFYSLVQDLQGLVAAGAASNVPNIALNAIGGPLASGRQTWMLSFGNLGNLPNRRTVVFTGGVHAREWIAPEITYLVAEYLIRNYVAAPPPGTNQRVRFVHDIVNSRNLHFIPMLNPDGNDRSVFGAGGGDRMWRKNIRVLPNSRQAWVNFVAPGGVANPPFQNVRPSWMLLPWAVYDVPTYAPPGVPPGAATFRTRWLSNSPGGVDVNRNFPTVTFGYDGSDDYDPTADGYFGPSAASETETGNVVAAMANAAAGANIDVAIDYHSFARVILYPSEAFYAGPAAAYTGLGTSLAALIGTQGGSQYTLGSPLARVGYDATATVSGYAALAHLAKAFTVELDPATQAQGGFQLPENQIRDVFRQNIRGALAAIRAPASPADANRGTVFLAPWNVFNSGNQVP